MKFKVDGNLPVAVRDQFRKAGHDAVAVFDEKLGGHADRDILEICMSEARILLTLDTDFGNIRAYPPEDCCGIIVIRADDQSKRAILELTSRILAALQAETVGRRLWVVEKNRIRVRGRE